MHVARHTDPTSDTMYCYGANSHSQNPSTLKTRNTFNATAPAPTYSANMMRATKVHREPPQARNAALIAKRARHIPLQFSLTQSKSGPDPKLMKQFTVRIQSKINKIRHSPVSSEISDFTPCTHAQTDILHDKYADKTDYQGLGIRVQVSVSGQGEKNKNN